MAATVLSAAYIERVQFASSNERNLSILRFFKYLFINDKKFQEHCGKYIADTYVNKSRDITKVWLELNAKCPDFASEIKHLHDKTHNGVF